MTIENAINYLIERGYKKDKTKTDENIYMYKRLNGASNCQCNERSPNIGATIHNFKEHVSLEINLRAEAVNGQWVNIGYYSMPLNEIKEINTYEFIIEKMWETCN